MKDLMALWVIVMVLLNTWDIEHLKDRACSCQDTEVSK